MLIKLIYLERKYFGIVTVYLMMIIKILPNDHFTKSKSVKMFFSPRHLEDCGLNA